MKRKPSYFLGIFEGHYDPAVAVVSEGEILIYMEEERLLRLKHAPGAYPERALQFCLQSLDLAPEDISAIGLHWNLSAYTDGTMSHFFTRLQSSWPVDEHTLKWQQATLERLNAHNVRIRHELHWRRLFGSNIRLPPIMPAPHHYTHAFQSAMQSPFSEAICITADGSGDQHTTVVWEKRDHHLRPLREVYMPHSLGWFYAAFTEYLGFEAYDGEYKVMGLAAYGTRRPEIMEIVGRILKPCDRRGLELDPTFIHYGKHTYSGRFTDRLVNELGRKPRSKTEAIDSWHMDVAYAAQATLERVVERLVIEAVDQTGIKNICIGGGVGHNVKMNSRIFRHPKVEDVFAHPLCSDGGAAAGAALVACYRSTGALPNRLTTVALGNEQNAATVEGMLDQVGINSERSRDLHATVADALRSGKIVGWVQGRMEAGPRALGQRSILADPRSIDSRDRVNAIVKHREAWRPFCPSIIAEAAPQYFDAHTDARFMTIAFGASSKLVTKAPAIVHVDGTSRVQLVHAATQKSYYKLLKAFERKTGIPILLNTSFNVAGEPIVCTALDAIRTFCATGIDILVINEFLIRKPVVGESR